ncbi:MAG: flavodoxin domain-containing protein, partial [Beijerinckiaceae bacterium]
MQLYYATRDGQSRRIAERIAGRLAERGIASLPQDLAVALPAPRRLAEARLVTIVVAVRYGRHLPEGEQFLAIYRTLRAPPPLVFLSVSLTARKPGKDTAEGNVYLRKTIARHRLAPALAVAIAGRLDYARCGWLDRQLIRFIMKLTRRADRSQGLDRIYGVECGRRRRPADRRPLWPHRTVTKLTGGADR